MRGDDRGDQHEGERRGGAPAGDARAEDAGAAEEFARAERGRVAHVTRRAHERVPGDEPQLASQRPQVRADARDVS